MPALPARLDRIARNRLMRRSTLLGGGAAAGLCAAVFHRHVGRDALATHEDREQTEAEDAHRQARSLEPVNLAHSTFASSGGSVAFTSGKTFTSSAAMGASSCVR